MADVANRKLIALTALWEGKRGRRPMPSRTDLRVSELKPWLGNLALIDLNDVGDGTFRLCGMNLSARFGIDATGCRVAALSDDLVETILAFTARTRETNAPVRNAAKRMVHGEQVAFDDLALPLSNDGAVVATLIFASYPRR